jgi:tetratricopeptide (TPR) repeat protein
MGQWGLRRISLISLVCLFCVAPLVSAVLWVQDRVARRGGTPQHGDSGAEAARKEIPTETISTETISIDKYQLSPLIDAGLMIAGAFTGPIRDETSLEDLGAAIQARGRDGLTTLRKQLQQIPSDSPLQEDEARLLQQQIGMLLIYEGRFDEAADWFAKLLASSRPSHKRSLAPSAKQAIFAKSELTAILGMIAFRRGEVDNCIACVGPSSCIFPIVPQAVHANKAGSREAIRHFTAYLKEVPGDLRIRWLLNLSYMTLGEYPDKVPPQFLVPLDRFRSQHDVGRFENVAPLVGLTARGPNLAGGSVFDDFTGDGLPDVFLTSLDGDRGASLFVNKGDGTFEDRSEAAGLSDQVYALNVVRADYDNDGDLDVLLLRGGWEKPMRLSLLQNDGHGVFKDVTVGAGLARPIATESAAWGDYDNDGFVDLFVCGEYGPPFDDRNACRLYRNQGDGTFVDVAAKAGVLTEQKAKGCAWGDYDGDGWLDLYVSNMRMRGTSRLYRNQGDGTLRDVAQELGVNGPDYSFACWFWDYDNDGQLDLLVNDYQAELAEIVAQYLGAKLQRPSRPRLYRNLGPGGFLDVTKEVGLDRAMIPMGCNFGDIDNDGYLDFYLGTGRMTLEALVPNRMFKNVGAQRFEDVTMSSGTGHLQKGHGISFADWDCDGDLDLFVEAGGAAPGDKAYNLLFQNPGHGRHWLKVKLVGKKTNRAALGARIKAVVKGADGTSRSIYRTVGNNSSFGGNSLVELLGLVDATSVAELEVSWPTSRTTQTFRNIAADQMIVITEGTDSFKPLPQKPLQVPRDKLGHSLKAGVPQPNS